jgi:hypothetical protein
VTAGMEHSDAKFSGLMRRERLLSFGGLIALIALWLPCGRAAAQEAQRPLPDLHQFLSEVRERLHSDEFLLDQYTFTERHTENRLDANGKISKSTSAVYEVYPSPEPGHTYRRLVSEDGRPLSPEELAREDRKQEEKEAKASARTAEQDARTRSTVEERRREKEAAAIEEVFRIYDIRIVRREPLDGRDAILLTFQPRPDVKAETKSGKMLQHLAGRAWIDEEDRQVVRVEAALIDDLSFGLGVLARLKQGAAVSLTRRKVNDEIWLPSQAHFTGHARLLLVKAIRLDSFSEYSDYKKFSVATESAVNPAQQSRP